eukprot:m.181227 g.181227  ORF g.181227 m.181227 type:complete len:1072 (+) comp25448_c0_seq2:54-3269(+)
MAEEEAQVLVLDVLSSLRSPSPSPSSNTTLLDKFLIRFQHEREFKESYFRDLFETLVKSRLCSPDWMHLAQEQVLLRTIAAIRLLIRCPRILPLLSEIGGVKELAALFKQQVNLYLNLASSGQTVKGLLIPILTELASIFQKLTANMTLGEWLVSLEVHRSFVLLLASNHDTILHCALHGLVRLARSETPRVALSNLNCVEPLLRILQDYPPHTKRLATELLHTLCLQDDAREQVQVFNGIPIILSLLHIDDPVLLMHAVGVTERLSADFNDDVRDMGGVSSLVALINPNREALSPRPPSASSLSSSQQSLGVDSDTVLTLQSRVCSALTQLALNDLTATQIRDCNGVYFIALLLLQAPESLSPDVKTCPVRHLQLNAFRALRFLFSVERNRRVFKRLFPADLFEMFIDVGHFCAALDKYTAMVDYINSLSSSRVVQLRQSFSEINTNRAPSHFVREYAILEKLGEGSFGAVYRVQKKSMMGPGMQARSNVPQYALKEIPLRNPLVFGSTTEEQDKSLDVILNEVKIMQSQLRHPRVVRYFKSFCEDNKLYIVMELCEGASLQDHINALVEKKQHMEENRIWRIFLQICMGLRYIHKDKRVVHRDLTPANIMIGWNDAIKITDFGLARQKMTETSFMMSSVGTLVYSCPEVIKNEPYGERADIWALGCILYQVAMLQPPFYASNIVALARKIVEGVYEPIPEGQYSPLMMEVIGACLTPDTSVRPDILGVCRMLTSIAMKELDSLTVRVLQLENNLEKEKQRTQRHIADADRNKKNYQRLFLAHQDQIDRTWRSSTSQQSTEIDLPPDFLLSPKIQTPTSGRPLSPQPPASSSARLPFAPSPPDSNSFSHRRIKRSISSPARPPTATSTASTVDNDVFLENRVGSGTRSLRRTTSSRIRSASSSTAGRLTISPSKVREIHDPIQPLLIVLQKIIFISHLPPSLTQDVARHVVETYKRALFVPQKTSFNLKTELKKLLDGSKEVVDIDFGTGVKHLFRKEQATPNSANEYEGGQEPSFDELHQSQPTPSGTGGTSSPRHGGMTYEQLQRVIESVLEDHGYYEMNGESLGNDC